MTTAKVPPAKLARIVEWIRHHLYRLNQRLVPAPAAMLEMILATWTSQAITAAAQLGVADALGQGAQLCRSQGHGNHLPSGRPSDPRLAAGRQEESRAADDIPPEEGPVR